MRRLLVTGLVTLAGACRSPAAPDEARVRVEVGPPTQQQVEVTLRYPIELEAAEKVAVSPVAVSGFLSSVLVDVGDKVKAGQVIAMVDCREYAAQRTQAETAISRWQAQEEESRSQLSRLMTMDQNKLVAPAELDRARAAHRVSEAQLADAQAKLSEATQRQGYCWLKSPFDGYVSERNLDPGAMVGPGGQAVVTIVKTRDVKVVASVTEQDAPKVRRDAEVDVVLHAFPDRPFRGTVARLGRSLDPKTRTLTVEMDIPNAQEHLLPGMTGRAAIVVGKRENALLLPVTALLNLEEGSYAFVVRDTDGKPRAHRVEVKLGVDLGDWIEALEGIAADDQVILVGRELVTEGTWVEPRPSVAQPPAVERPEKATPEPRVASLTAGKPPAADDDQETEGETPTKDAEKRSADAKAADAKAADAKATESPNVGKKPPAPPPKKPSSSEPAAAAAPVVKAPPPGSAASPAAPPPPAAKAPASPPSASPPTPPASGSTP